MKKILIHFFKKIIAYRDSRIAKIEYEKDFMVGPKVVIENKNEFIIEAAKVAMHALLVNAKPKQRDPKGIALQARQYAVDLWRVMRLEVK